MRNKKIYERPFCKDISEYGVCGLEPLGFCEYGTTPTTSSCATGGLPANDPDDCAPVGFRPERGACYTGGNVAHGCDFGSYPEV